MQGKHINQQCRSIRTNTTVSSLTHTHTHTHTHIPMHNTHIIPHHTPHTLYHTTHIHTSHHTTHHTHYTTPHTYTHHTTPHTTHIIPHHTHTPHTSYHTHPRDHDLALFSCAPTWGGTTIVCYRLRDNWSGEVGRGAIKVMGPSTYSYAHTHSISSAPITERPWVHYK